MDSATQVARGVASITAGAEPPPATQSVLHIVTALSHPESEPPPCTTHADPAPQTHTEQIGRETDKQIRRGEGAGKSSFQSNQGLSVTLDASSVVEGQCRRTVCGDHPCYEAHWLDANGTERTQCLTADDDDLELAVDLLQAQLRTRGAQLQRLNRIRFTFNDLDRPSQQCTPKVRVLFIDELGAEQVGEWRSSRTLAQAQATGFQLREHLARYIEAMGWTLLAIQTVEEQHSHVDWQVNDAPRVRLVK